MKIRHLKMIVLSLLAGLVMSVAAHADVMNVSNKALALMIEKDIPIIDVRRQDEWTATGIIEGSHLLTFFDKRGRYDAEAWLAELEKIVKKDEPFVLICAAGVRSRSIANLLDQREGYTGVHNVTKGIYDWIVAKQPTVPAPKP